MKGAIIFGSQSDVEKMRGAARCLESFGIDYETHILSAHRVPEELEKVIANLESTGGEFIIAGAGLAAHLPGVIASKTILPVIGVPLKGAFEGLDSLMSMVQMPKPIPVATVGVNNSFNGAMVAVEILAIKYESVKEKLIGYRKQMKIDFINDNKEGIIL